MIAYLRGEPGGDVVRSLLTSSTDTCYAHALNLLEVYYDFVRKHSEQVANQAMIDLAHDGVTRRREINKDFLQNVGRLKARGRISLADCFCIALAQQLGGQVVTSDHHEYDPFVHLGTVAIRFIR